MLCMMVSTGIDQRKLHARYDMGPLAVGQDEYYRTMDTQKAQANIVENIKTMERMTKPIAEFLKLVYELLRRKQQGLQPRREFRRVLRGSTLMLLHRL